MQHPISQPLPRPLVRRWPPLLLVLAGLSVFQTIPAAAQDLEKQEIRIALKRGEVRNAGELRAVRRQIASAARELCGSGGLTSTYRNRGRLCRESLIADAERQLEPRIATRLAASVEQ